VAFADPDERSRKWGRDTAGPDAREYREHRALLGDAEVDAVVVATPNHTHREVLEDVFDRGVHVLVEKPLCTTLADARHVAGRAAAHPGVVWVGMEYRYMPPVARLLEEVRAGRAGRLRMLAIREHRFPFLPKVGNWNRFAANTGGTLVEKCCHFFDLMCLVLAARPLRVYASGAQDVNHLDERYDGRVPDILDNAYAIVDFEGGARALLDLCMFAEASRHQSEIAAVGDAGKVECTLPAGELVIGTRQPRHVDVQQVPVDERLRRAGAHHGATYHQHLAFRRAVLGRGPVEVTAEDGLRAVALGLAAERSVAEGRPVELGELLGPSSS
jgi:myo-inositol 2-dehydrogenase/D-chiro-inositol 1-dehydrogenase